MTRKRTLTLALGSALLLSGCDTSTLTGFLKSSDKTEKAAQSSPSGTNARTARDVEAPDVFKMAENGLWDGRPSLGGVWVAHPDVKDPERVIIRNQSNGKSVIGALFRRERDVPGPRFQVSSDAAVELGMLAGAPAGLSVTALRKTSAADDAITSTAKQTSGRPEKQAVAQDPIAAATAALDQTEAASAKSAAAPKSTPRMSRLSKPYVQLGIFSVEINAQNTAEAVRQAGLSAVIKPGHSNGKGFWRVLAGPAANRSDRAALLKKIKALGFADAYWVSK